MMYHAASCTVILVDGAKVLRRLVRALASRISRLWRFLREVRQVPG